MLQRSRRGLNENNSDLLTDFNFYPDCDGGIGMKIEIDIPKHQYKNIMDLDSISLGRAPYKGIIMYAINAIKKGKALDQEPTTKNDLGVDCISRKAALDITWHDPSYSDPLNVLTEVRDKIRELPSLTPQEPKTGHWRKTGYIDKVMCSICNRKIWNFWEANDFDYCPNCGAKMESEGEK